ncbi:MAG: CocE/NonD family hydrolase [Paramuribaculum sp.]|nr:CocE/NonD family hydrolase [Paramuribaculum sp.]
MSKRYYDLFWSGSDKRIRSVWRVVSVLMAFLSVFLPARGGALTGAWRGSLELGPAKLPLVFNFTDGEGGGILCSLDSPQQGAYGIAAKVVFSDGDSLAVEVPGIRASYSGRIGRSEITGVFSQSGRSFPLSLSRELPIEERRPQTPRAPFPYSVTDSFFVSADGVRLAGTVVVPAGGLRKDVPMVVMVTGSGPQNRDEELFEHRPFAVIADYLGRRGIASFRYDDRGTGASGGVFATSDIDDFAMDAEAALEFARSLNPEGRTGFLGHSEGGTIALMLGAKGVPDFVVSLAGMAVKGRDLLLEQNRHSLSRREGLTDTQKEEILLLVDHVFASIEDGCGLTDGEIDDYIAGHCRSVSPAVVAQVKNSIRSDYFRKFVALNPPLWLKDIRKPVFALNGSLDTQVRAKANLMKIKESVVGSRVKEYEGLNHLFQHAQSGEMTEYGDIAETISEEVLKDVAEFVMQQK